MDIRNYELFSGMTYSEVLAASAASPSTKYYLALCYRDGRGVKRDEKIFRKLLKESAAEGAPMAMAYLDALANGCGGRSRRPLFAEPEEEKKENSLLFLTRPAQRRELRQEGDALFLNKVEPVGEEAARAVLGKKAALEELLGALAAVKRNPGANISLEQYEKLSPMDRDEVLYLFMKRFRLSMTDEFLRVIMEANKDRIRILGRTFVFCPFEKTSRDLISGIFNRKNSEAASYDPPDPKLLQSRLSEKELSLFSMELFCIYLNEGTDKKAADRIRKIFGPAQAVEHVVYDKKAADRIRKIFLQLIDGPEPDDAGYWPLIFGDALKMGDYEIVRALMAKDPAIFDREDFLYSVLESIPMENPESRQFLSSLFAAKVRVNGRKKCYVDGFYEEESALALAVKKGYADVVRTMLAAGAEPDFGKSWVKRGWRHETSPLTYAIETKNAEIVEELLSRGANAAIGKRWSEEGILCMERPLFTALKERQMEISRLLLENGTPMGTGKIWIERGALHKRDSISMAVEQGADYTCLLLRHGTGANGGHRWKSLPKAGGDTARMEDGSPRRELREEEDAECWYEESAIAFAAQEKQSVPLVRLLLENGADIKTIGPLPSDWRSPMYRFLKERGI